MRAPNLSKPFRALVSATVLALAALSASAVLLAAPAAADDPVGPPSSDLAAASAQAKSHGQPVEVADKTTETTRVMAEPDGTFTLTSSRNPVRVKRNGAWHAIDTTLRVNPDGTLTPAATTADFRFSGGGNSPLVEIRDGDRSVAYRWPHALPTPSVSGDTATYQSVFPGVDVKVKALAEGYAESLVVHDARAAANPALRHLTFDATAAGVTLVPAAGGALNALDGKGQTVFQGATPVMWDSTNNQASQVGAPASAFDPGSGEVIPLAVTAHAANGLAAPAVSTVTLTPPATALLGAHVRYPVYIDPEMDKSEQHWAVTFSGGSHFYDSGIDDFKVGYCDFSNCGSWVNQNARAYFQMGITDLAQAGVLHIYSAGVSVYEIHGSQGCTPEPVRLFTASNITSANTVWPGPSGGFLQSASSAAGDNCGGAAWVDFTSNAALVGYIQGLASAQNTRANFALVANAESNDVYWKRFSENPTLTVHYNYYPDPPLELGVTGSVDCTSTHYVSGATPQLAASAKDNNPAPLNVTLTFKIFAAGDTATALVTSPGQVAVSGVKKTWSVPATSALHVDPGGTSYQYQTSVVNNPPDPSYVDPLPARTPAAFYPFTILPAPTAVPRASSVDYPVDNWGAPVGSNGTISLSDNGALNTVGFAYGWDNSTNIPVVSDCNYNQSTAVGGLISGSGTAALTVPSTLAAGPHTLWVRSFDGAHNLSPTSSAYSFYVSPAIAGEGAVRTEAESASATATNGTVTTAAVSGDSNGQEVQLTGTASSADFTFNTGVDAYYALGVELVDGPGNGQLSFTIDGNQATQPDGTALTTDTAASSRSLAYQPLGGIHLTAGTHHLSATLTQGSQAAFDFLTAIPISNVTTTSFSNAMNNRGIAVDGTTAANITMASSGAMRGYSSQSLATAGWSAGSTVTVGGASFAMPARNSAGNDNVVAAGQTIPLASQVNATAMGFVVASVCGANGAPAMTGTFTYANGTTSTARFPAIPDWSTGSTDTAALNLPVQELGTSQDTSSRSHFYVVFVPTDPTKALASVTLPNYGTNFLPCSMAVHVFAMAPRLIAQGWEGSWAAPVDSTTTPVGGANLANQTVRMIVHPTTGGSQIRVRLSNTANAAPATIDTATVAAQGTSNDAATTATPQTITFCLAKGLASGCSGGGSISIPAGGEVYSDPVAMPTGGSGNLAVSIHLPTEVTSVPTHTGGNTTNYVGAGNQVSATVASAFSYTTTNSYFLTGVDVVSDSNSTDGTTVVLGDSTSAAGSGSSTYQPTWLDDLPSEYNSGQGAPLVGGLVNASLRNKTSSWWATPDASGTVLNTGVLAEPNVRTVVVSLGANDVLAGVSWQTIETNIKALDLMVNDARYGVGNYDRPDGSAVEIALTTIPALGLAASDPREAVRQQVNLDITGNLSNFFADGLVDIDATTADPANPSQLAAGYLTGGVPNASYYLAVADAFANQVPPVL